MNGDHELLDRCLQRDQEALALLVHQLTPVVQARVARALWKRAFSARGRDVRQELADMVQNVFVALFENDSRKLRAWDPERGLSLAGFVGYLAEREVYSRLRRGRSSPWTEDPVPDETLAANPAPLPSPETVTLSRDRLRSLVARVQEELTPLARHVFQLLFIEQLEVREICAQLAMTEDAVYAWRSRLTRKIRTLNDELESETATRRHNE